MAINDSFIRQANVLRNKYDVFIIPLKNIYMYILCE